MTPAISIPARAKHVASVIFIHGLGDSGAGWSFLPELFAAQNRLPGVKWILPSAPNTAVTINGGMKMPSWYDIKSLADIDQDEAGMLGSVKIIHDLIDAEIAHGVAAEKIIVAGFSQGCAMSILSGLMYKKSLCAIIGLSGYLPLRHKFEQLREAANKSTPMWLGHGTADPVVNMKYGKMTAETLKNAGMNVSWNQYAGVGHTADPAEITDLANFLEKLI